MNAPATYSLRCLRAVSWPLVALMLIAIFPTDALAGRRPIRSHHKLTPKARKLIAMRILKYTGSVDTMSTGAYLSGASMSSSSVSSMMMMADFVPISITSIATSTGALSVSGKSTGSGSLTTSGSPVGALEAPSPVPEPSSALLALIGAVYLSQRRRRE